MDPLSDLLEVAGLRGRVFCHTVASAPWGLQMPPAPRVGLHVVTRGGCWLRVRNGERDHPLSVGDVVLLPHGCGHALFDAPGSELLGFEAWKASKNERHELVRSSGGSGARTHLICGGYDFAAGHAHPLVQLLPPLITARASGGGGLDSALQSLHREFKRPDAASPTIMSRLLDVVLLEVLRQWMHSREEGETVWLGGLRDSAVVDALSFMHREPARPWTVEQLAREVGLSRAVMARRFRVQVGHSPLAYLGLVRMNGAARLLRAGEHSVAEVARKVGYDSESAFNRAFKREHGVPPGRFARQRRRTPQEIESRGDRRGIRDNLRALHASTGSDRPRGETP